MLLTSLLNANEYIIATTLTTERVHTTKNLINPLGICICTIYGIIKAKAIKMKFLQNICMKYLRAGKSVFFDKIYKLTIKCANAGIEPTKYIKGGYHPNFKTK